MIINEHLLSYHNMVCAVLSTLYAFSHLFLTTILWGRNWYGCHFLEEETERISNLMEPRYKSGLTPGSVFSPACNMLPYLGCGHGAWVPARSNIWAVCPIIYSSGPPFWGGVQTKSALPLPCKRCPSEWNWMVVSLIIWDKSNWEGFIHSEWFSDLIF